MKLDAIDRTLLILLLVVVILYLAGCGEAAVERVAVPTGETIVLRTAAEPCGAARDFWRVWRRAQQIIRV